MQTYPLIKALANYLFSQILEVVHVNSLKSLELIFLSFEATFLHSRYVVVPSKTKLLVLAFASVQYQQGFFLFRKWNKNCIIQVIARLSENFITLFSYKKRPNSVVCEMKRLATFHKRAYLRYPALPENNRLDPKKTTLCTHAFSRHVDVCCRRDTGAEYIWANEKLFYISYHMTEWIERVIFSEKNTLARRLNFFQNR